MPYQFQTYVTYASILMIIGLAITILAMIRLEPLIFALFMTVGVLAMTIAILLYFYVVIKDLRLHKVI